jgi:hypothetical protein
MQRLGFLLGLVLASACSDGQGGDSAFGSGNTVGAMSSTGASTASGSEPASSAPASSSDDDSTAGGGEGTNFTTDPGFSTGPSVECDAPLSACGVLCVDHQSDPANCGDCGITCVVPNGQSSCVAGNCSVGDCELGWFDCDGSPVNGCEAQAGCAGGEACTTACGSTGVTACDGCDIVCEVPAESCNAIDDDCNGSCDEGAMAGCRQSVHRSIGANGHYYTNVLAETSQSGRTLEVADYWWMYAAQAEGLTALHRCDIGGGNTFLTTNNACEGAGSIAATLGYLSPEARCGSTALYRLRSPAGRHFYTTSAAERDNAVNNLGYISEGSPGQIWTAP